VAGIGRMHYPRVLAFDVGGGIFWVCAFTLLGYFFGNVPIVKQNFGLVIVGVIVVSVVPIFVEVLRARSERV
jgi:membrane-associated protein